MNMFTQLAEQAVRAQVAWLKAIERDKAMREKANRLAFGGNEEAFEAAAAEAREAQDQLDMARRAAHRAMDKACAAA
jgi:hypothetical protein